MFASVSRVLGIHSKTKQLFQMMEFFPNKKIADVIVILIYLIKKQIEINFNLFQLNYLVIIRFIKAE